MRDMIERMADAGHRMIVVGPSTLIARGWSASSPASVLGGSAGALQAAPPASPEADRDRRRRQTRCPCAGGDADAHRFRSWPTHCHRPGRHPHAEIDALLQEDRRFPPSGLSTSAPVTDPDGLRAAAPSDPEAFWAAFARELEWMRRGTGCSTGSRRTRSGSSAASSTRASTASTATCADRAAQQGGDHLGGRAGRPAHAHLLGPLPRGRRSSPTC